MSDILEDQRIHFIVKDYRRMYNNYWSLKAIIEEQNKSLEKKDKEILILRNKINELKKDTATRGVKPSVLKGILNEIEVISNSMNNRLLQVVEQTNKVSKNAEELREFLKV